MSKYRLKRVVRTLSDLDIEKVSDEENSEEYRYFNSEVDACKKSLLTLYELKKDIDRRIKNCESIVFQSVIEESKKQVKRGKSIRERNKEVAKSLKVGDKVQVIKTGEIGVVTGFVVYGTGQPDEIYDYTSIKVHFADGKNKRKRNRRFSGRSLKKV